VGDDRLIGQTLDGRYHIERKIGEGSMGVVFAARHAVIEKQLAIKVLKREVARDAATVARFVQEAKAATRIGHPSIVDVSDFGTTPDGMTYSVMEYVDGATLTSVIQRDAPLSLARTLPIIAQIAGALGAAHAKGVVHRDLEPDNVFLIDRDGRREVVKIVDFAGGVVGTPEYMAPEQAAGRSDTDHRVDVYALATILYEMLTGAVPRKRESVVRRARPELAITAELERVVMKGRAENRDERYPSMADFLSDLERACPGVDTDEGGLLQLVTAPPGADARALVPLPNVTEPRARDIAVEPRRRARGPVLLLLVALAAGGGVAAALVLRGGAPPAAPTAAVDAAVARASADAAVIAAGATRVVEVRLDAGVADAGTVTPQRAPRKQPAGAVSHERATPRATIAVQVLSKPDGATIYAGDSYRGVSGVTLEQPQGSTVRIKCTLPGHDPGFADVTFDGRAEVVLCRPVRSARCVDDLKNPFDDCPED